MYGKEYDIVCALRASTNQVAVSKENVLLKENESHINHWLNITIDSPLRQLESPIEKMFWDALRVEHFITPQKKIGPYRVDFAIEHLKIVIELDGHEHHKTKEQRTNDSKRERYLQSQGWYVIRFTGSEIWKDVDGCVQEMLKILREVK